MKLNKATLKAMSALSGYTPEQCLAAFEQYETSSKGDAIISGKEIRKIYGWSFQTWKRRLHEYGINEVKVPGWKSLMGVNRREFERKTGLKIPSHKEA